MARLPLVSAWPYLACAVLGGSVALAARLPAQREATDDWIRGQRVRYALEARDAAAARALVAECGGTAWWCDALAGLVWHAEGEEARAARAFAAALRAMPDSLRCAWLDARAWLPPRAAKRARHA